MFWLFSTVLGGFIAKGCYSQSQKPSPVSIEQLTVDSCSLKCLETNFSFISIDTECYCLSNLTLLQPQNVADCTNKCLDQSPCGGNQRVSVYELQKAIEPPIDRNAPNNTTTSTNNGILGQGDSINQRQIALYSGLGAAFIIIVILTTVYIRRKNRLAKVPTLPRYQKKKEESSDLILKLLPKTSNMMYSVFTDYQPIRVEELKLKRLDVVCIQSFDTTTQWAFGCNITTGQKGNFPMICLVDPQLIQGVVVIPSSQDVKKNN